QPPSHPVAQRVVLTAQLTPAAPTAPGGVCQVPGIGDIGGLVGLCSQGSAGILGDLNNICEPSLPQPEQATGGIDNMVQPPAAPGVGTGGGKTLYDNYGVAGQFWAAHGLQCSDMTSLIGNNVAGMVFDAAKSIDRVTITVYQSAAGNNILTWLQDAVNKLITALGNAIYFPYLAPVVILGAMWLAWQGLIRKRATRTIEGTLWMVVAATAAIALIGHPAAFTGVGTTVSNGVTGVLNTAFAKLPAPANSNCLPVAQGDPQSVAANYAFTSGNGLVDQNADELWSVLVCKPWLLGELGTSQFNPLGQGPQTVVDTYGRQLLWSQAYAANETPTTALSQAKQSTYAGIATQLQQNDPAVYPLFQGNQWTTRLEIAFGAMFAALVAGLLILLIALTLIVLKLGFLLLLVAGPFFLIIGTHPGFGRIIAIRWFEMIVGVLMKQAAVAIVLSVLLYCYSLIMGTTDQALPWALKILMIALVTVAVFIYRKPFTHLFSAVGYGTLGSTERAEVSLRDAGFTFRRNTATAASVAIPGVAGNRVARWARRNPGQVATVAAGVASGAGAGATNSGEAANAAAVAAGDAYASRFRADAPPAADGDGEMSASTRRGAGAASLARNRSMPETESGSRTAPPLDLPPRTGNGTASAASSWSRGAGRSAGPAGAAGPGRARATSGGAPSRSGGTGGTSGGTTGGPAPAWPHKPASSGWAGGSSGAGPRQRPPAERRPASQGQAQGQGQNRAQGSGNGTEEQRAMPFWLRPIRRDK
ncbi:MAG TPA: type IV secretion system protein, partial [Streptosporangiaceae bacterium]|nr:type IV secretion system protein [Streptosporangiaceae bacterium]